MLLWLINWKLSLYSCHVGLVMISRLDLCCHYTQSRGFFKTSISSASFDPSSGLCMYSHFCEMFQNVFKNSLKTNAALLQRWRMFTIFYLVRLSIGSFFYRFTRALLCKMIKIITWKQYFHLKEHQQESETDSFRWRLFLKRLLQKQACIFSSEEFNYALI